MNIPYVFKKCTKCGEWLVASTVNFNKHNKYKYGLRSVCKKCTAEYRKQYYEDNKCKYDEQWYKNNKDKTKTCTKCGETLPVTPEYFYKNKHGKYGLSSECKKCKVKQSRKKNYDKKIEKYFKNSQTTLITLKEKKCTECGKVLPAEEFYKTKHTKDGLYNKCKKCLRKQVKEYKLKKLKERGW